MLSYHNPQVYQETKDHHFSTYNEYVPRFLNHQMDSKDLHIDRDHHVLSRKRKI